MLRADRRVVVSHVTTGPPSGFNPLPRRRTPATRTDRRRCRSRCAERFTRVLPAERMYAAWEGSRVSAV